MSVERTKFQRTGLLRCHKKRFELLRTEESYLPLPHREKESLAMDWLTPTFLLLELIGTASFAVAGAMHGIRQQFDVFGVILLGIVTAVGGGIIRDILIGRFPPDAFLHGIYVEMAFFAALTVFLLAYFRKADYIRFHDTLDSVNNFLDALGLGVFTVSGTQVGMETAYSDQVFFCVFLGVMTGIGGGLLRDVMSRSVPVVLRKRIYAVASILGGLLYYILCQLEVCHAVCILAPVALICIIRVCATHFKWNLPTVKLTDKLPYKR